MLNKLSKIDRLTLADHYYLRESDEIWYFGEYTPGERYKSAPANQLIRNIKRERSYYTDPPTGAWYYKLRDIERVAQALASLLGMNDVTFVPIPPSVVRTDPTYDPHNLDILRSYQKKVGRADVRELIYQRHSTRKSHLNNAARVTQQELLNTYVIDEALVTPAPKVVVLFDDVLTTGTHFLAARQVVQERFPGLHVAGLVVCRRKLTNPVEGVP